MTSLLRLAGVVRRRLRLRGSSTSSDWRLSSDSFAAFANEARQNCSHVRRVSALLELNSGLPFGLTSEELDAAGPQHCLDLFLRKAASASPGIDPEMLSRLVVQYELQVRAHHNYRLNRYDGTVCLIEPAGRHQGLHAALIAPYVRTVRTWVVPVSTDPRPSTAGVFPEAIQEHYYCMRDDHFAASTADIISAVLREQSEPRETAISSTR